MDRRESLLGLLALGAANGPLSVFAQSPGRTYRVGALIDGSPEFSRDIQRALLQRLGELGFVDGRNLRVEWRASLVVGKQAHGIVRELMAARPDAFFTTGPKYVPVLQEAVSPAPIVFANVGDALAFGLVKDYARPGGNVTGVSLRQGETMLKRIEILRELLPRAKRVAVVGNTANPMFERNRDSLWSVATSKFGFELALANVGASEVSAALDAVRKPRLDALLVELVAGGSGEWYVPKVIEYAERHRLPAVYPASTAAAAGGLLSFGADLVDDIRRGADQLARILKGANAAETPIDQATRFELVVKLRTAGALGLKIPQSILVRADRVIE